MPWKPIIAEFIIDLNQMVSGIQVSVLADITPHSRGAGPVAQDGSVPGAFTESLHWVGLLPFLMPLLPSIDFSAFFLN